MTGRETGSGSFRWLVALPTAIEMQRRCGNCFVFASAVLLATVVVRSEGPSADNATLTSQPASPPIVAIAVSPSDGASGEEKFIAASQAGFNPQQFRSTITHPHDISFSPDGRSLVVCGGDPGQSGRAEIYDWPVNGPASEPRQVLSVGDDSLYAAAWSASGDLLAIAGLDGFGRVFDAATGQARLRLIGHSRGLTGIEFLHSGRLVTTSLDGSLRVWDAESGELLRTLANHTGAVTGLCLGSQQGPARQRMAASIGDDRTVRIWQPDIGRLVRFARLPSKPLAAEWLSRNAVATAHNGLLAIACLDGHVRVVSVATVEILADRQLLDGPAYCITASATEDELFVAGHAAQTRRIRVAELLSAPSSTN